jgi:hypothetical protein
MKYGNFTNGIGISDSDSNRFYRMVNIDIHSKPGKAQCSRSLTDIDSSDLVTSKPTCSVVASDGNTYIGAGTKIFKVTSAGVISLAHTNTEGAVLGLGEHKGYIYYASATKLGRQSVSNASSEASWSSQDDDWAIFTNQKAYKPMVWVNQILCIGDGNYVAIVDENGDFNANALDVLERDIITALDNTNDYLSAGTFVSSVVHQASIYLWDTYSPSWSEDFKVNERGVNMFFQIDGYTYAQIGVIGNIYQWTGQRAVLFSRLRDGDNLVTTGINPYGTTNLNGLTLIATDRGVFSIGRADARLGLAQVIEYVGSAGQGADLGCIEAVGSNIFLGWKDGTDYGVDKIGTNYANGIIETPINYGKVSQVKVNYNAMPTGCSISSRVAVDGGSMASHTLVKDDEDFRQFRSDAFIKNKSEARAEITLNSATTNTPIISLIEIV